MNNQSVDYPMLEITIRSESSEQRKSCFASSIARIWNRIVEAIVSVNELKIYSLTDRSGGSYWVIHDLQLGRRVFFDSEEEVRDWLDRRYYE